MKKNTLILVIGVLVAITIVFALLNAKETKVSTQTTTGEKEHGGFFGFIEGLFSGVNVNIAGTAAGG